MIRCGNIHSRFAWLRDCSGGGDDRLAQAVKNNDAKTAKTLLAQHADANVILADKTTPLFWVADRQNDEIVGLLLAAAKTNVIDEYGNSPLRWPANTEIQQLLCR